MTKKLDKIIFIVAMRFVAWSAHNSYSLKINRVDPIDF